MITLFDERDLVSFGLYMISERRRDSIINNEEITDEETRQNILNTVTQFDFNNWLALKMKSEQEEQEQLSKEREANLEELRNMVNLNSSEEDTEEDTEEEQNPKVVKLTPKA